MKGDCNLILRSSKYASKLVAVMQILQTWADNVKIFQNLHIYVVK